MFAELKDTQSSNYNSVKGDRIRVGRAGHNIRNILYYIHVAGLFNHFCTVTFNRKTTCI